MQKQTVIFIPGGPGLNSYPEQNILLESFERNELNCLFWNEPSLFRKDGKHFSTDKAFSNWSSSFLEAIENSNEKVILIGSSFGALGCLYNLERISKKIHKLVFISPTIFLNDVFKEMMKMASNDFLSLCDSRSSEIQNCLNDTKKLFDTPMEKGLELTFQDPKLFLHYWRDHNLLGKWAKFLEHPDYQMDFTSQKAVLTELKSTPLKLNKTYPNLKIQVCIGKFDPVYLKNQTEKFLSEYFPQVSYHKFEQSSHFPHIEETEKFISLVKCD